MPKQYNPNNMTDLFMIMSSVELRALKPMSQTRKWGSVATAKGIHLFDPKCKTALERINI